MSSLTEALQQSQWLAPWVNPLLENRGANKPHLLTALQQSQLLGWLFKTEATERTLPYQQLFQTGLWVGFALWVVITPFTSTEIIGMGIWALAAWILLFGVLRQQFATLWTGLHIIDIAILAYFASALVSATFSSYEIQSIHGLFKASTFLVGYGVFRVAFCTFSLKQVLTLLGLLLGSAWVQAGIGLYQYTHYVQPLATWSDPETNPELQLTRIFGTLQPLNPNLLAGYLIPAVAINLASVGILWTSPKLRWTSLIAAAGLGLLLLALVLTGSRGGYLALGGMGITTVLLLGHALWHEPAIPYRSRLKTLYLVGLLLVGLIMVLLVASSQSLQHRLLSIFAMREDSSIAYRFNVYASSWQMFLDNWLFGIGPGNDVFKQVYGIYMVPGFNALGTYSVPLEILVEQGIVGFLLFCHLMLSTTLQMVFGFDQTETPVTLKFIFAGILIALVGFCGQGLFDTIWYRPAIQLLFWLLVALLVSRTQLLSNASSSVSVS